MTEDALEDVLRMVAEGHLTAAEAGPIIAALDRDRDGDDTDRPREAKQAQVVRVQVIESGQAVINLRIPLSLGRAAINQVPGLSLATSDRIREAIEAGIKGSIVEVDDDGDGVRISIE
jgi:hypothetical protein